MAKIGGWLVRQEKRWKASQRAMTAGRFPEQQARRWSRARQGGQPTIQLQTEALPAPVLQKEEPAKLEDRWSKHPFRSAGINHAGLGNRWRNRRERSTMHLMS